MIYDEQGRLMPPTRGELAIGYGRASIMEALGIEYVNPDTVARERGLAHYDDVARDLHTRSVWNTRVLALSGCRRAFLAGSDPRALELLRWNFEEHLTASGLTAIVESVFRSATKNGYAVSEIIWNPRMARGDFAGATVIDAILDKDPERFIIKPDGVYLKRHWADMDGDKMPPRKFWVAAYQPEYGNPYGTSLFQEVHWYAWFKRNGFKFWLVFLEKFGMPTVKGTIPAGFSDDAEIQRVREVLDSIQSRTSITIPAGFEIELLEASKTGAAGYETLIAVCNREISKAILGQTLTTQEGASSGSYALGKVHNDVRGDILIADGAWFDAAFNFGPAAWLIDYNFGQTARYPYLETQTQPEEDLNAAADRDCKLVAAGVRIPQSYFYEKYGIPAPVAGEPVAGQQTLNAPAPNPPTAFAERHAPNPPTAFAEQPAPKGKIAPTDALFESVMAQGGDAYRAAYVLPFIRLAETSTDFGTYQDGLNALKRNTDDFSAFFSDALVSAQILGRWVMQQRTASVRGEPVEPRPSTRSGRTAATFAENDDPDRDEPFLDVGVLYESLTPEAAAKFVAEKGVMTAKEFAALSDEAKRTAFAIANVEDKRVIALVQDEIAQAVREGWTYDEFKAAATEIFDAYGVMEIADYHLETLFRTNIQSAYNQGAWEMLHDPSVRDMIAYLVYDAIEDARTCGLCAALDGVTLPMDDPFWGTFWPPNHHRCRCDVRPVTQAAAKRDGVTPKAAPRTATVTVNGKAKTIEVYPADGFASAPTMGGFEP